MSTAPAFSLPFLDRRGDTIMTASEQIPWSVQRPISIKPGIPTGEFVVSELSMSKLNAIHKHLWIAGSHGNISPLHHQRVILRNIIPCEMAQLHLVWFDRIIYIKPLPDCLLNDSYYYNKGLEHSGEVVGFLRSYCSLIRYPVDLVVAKKYNLISDGVTWEQWATFRDTTLSRTEGLHINKRYEYGELRLNRLDIIYRLTGRGLTYFTVHRTYKTYFTQYFSLFVTIFAFVALVLTAMQVLVTIEGIPETVVITSYRFGVAVLVSVCLCFGYVLSVFVSMLVYNVVLALLAHRRHTVSTSPAP